MNVVTKRNIITKKVLNENTGELESTNYIEEHTVSKLKGGFNLMYHKSYEEITETVISSNLDMKLFNWITNEFTYKRVETSLSYLDFNDKTISISSFKRMIKKLVDINYLLRVRRGIYRLNPYIYIPYRANGSELQQEWDKLTKENDD